MPSSSDQARIGLRIALTIFWTIVLVAGLTIGVLLAAQGVADAVRTALTATVAATGIAAAVAVGMILVGLWGIASNHRNLKHAVELISAAGRARMETMQVESMRSMEPPK